MLLGVGAELSQKSYCSNHLPPASPAPHPSKISPISPRSLCSTTHWLWASWRQRWKDFSQDRGGWSQQNEYSVLVIFTREAPWQKEPKFSLCPLCRGKSSAAQKKTSRLIDQPGVNTLKGSVSLHAWTAASVSVDCDVQSVHFRSDRLFS